MNSSEGGREKRLAATAASIPGKKFQKVATGIDRLDPSDIQEIANNKYSSVPRHVLQQVYGLDQSVVHPSQNAAEECKGIQKHNPNSFINLSFKVPKKRKEGKGGGDDFHSEVARSDEVPFGGLKNLGATCYMNSMLQCLYHNVRFRNGVFELAAPGRMPADMRETCVPICELQKLFANLHVSKERMYDPASFAESLRLSTSVQQDAQEFLKLLLTYMEDNLHRQGVSQSLQSLIQDNFRGCYAYCTRCKECNNVSRVRNSFYDLDLNMQGITQLEGCLDDFFKKEELSGDNQYACEKCAKKTDAERGIELLDLPQFLHLQLMRFVYDVKSNARKKIQSPITFPLTLDLTKYVTNLRGDSASTSGNSTQAASSSSKAAGGKKRKSAGGAAAAEERVLFDLESVVLHSGAKASEGHYMAHARDRERRWWRFDDGHVSSLKDDEFFGSDEAIAKANKKRNPKEQAELDGRIKSKEAYMLIYRRRESGEGCAEPEVDVPEELAGPIRVQSREVLERMDAERTAHNARSLENAESNTLKEKVFNALPASGQNEEGFFIPTEWLKNWLTADVEKQGGKPPPVDTRSLVKPETNKADPAKVSEMKRISTVAWGLIVDNFGLAHGSTPLPCSSLCDETIIQMCVDRMQKSDRQDRNSKLKQMLRGECKDREKGYWISRQWCRIMCSGKEASSEEARGTDVLCSCSAWGDSGEEDRLTNHLTPDKSARRLIDEPTYLYICEAFANCKPFCCPGVVDSCRHCQERCHVEAVKEKEANVAKKELSKRLKALSEQKSMALQSEHTYCLVSAKWADMFLTYLQLSDFILPPVDNSELLDDSGQHLVYDPLDLSQRNPPYLWLPEEEWNCILDKFPGGGPKIQVVPYFDKNIVNELAVHVNRVPQKATVFAGRIHGRTTPEVDADAVEARKRKELDQSVNFTNGKISVVKKGVGGGALPAAYAPGSSFPRGGGRLRQRRGEVELTVSSTDTVQSVKVQLYEVLFHSPSEQVLHYDGKELADGDKTLADCGVPNRAVLVMTTRDTHDDDEVFGTSKTNDDDAGFRGTVLSGLAAAGRAEGPLQNAASAEDACTILDDLDDMRVNCEAEARQAAFVIGDDVMTDDNEKQGISGRNTERRVNNGDKSDWSSSRANGRHQMPDVEIVDGDQAEADVQEYELSKAPKQLNRMQATKGRS